MLSLSRKKAERLLEARRAPPDAPKKTKGDPKPPRLETRPFRAGLAAAANAPVDLAPLRARLEAATAAQVAKWVRLGEAGAAEAAPDAVVAGLRYAQPGDVLRVPATVLRPGQSQLSFDRVRDVLASFFSRLEGRSPAEVRALAEQLGQLEVPGVITADAASVVLPDRNHHTAALFALKGWLMEVNKGVRWHKAPGLAALHEVFLGEDAHVKVTVRQTFVGRGEADAEAALRDALYFVGRDGEASAARPVRFGDLEDNPYRALATLARIKVSEDDSKKGFELKTKEIPVWIKGPNAPDFVEFYLADVFAKALCAAGRPYDGRRALTEDDAALLRDALRRAQDDEDHPGHAVLSQVLVVPEEHTDPDDLEDALKLTKKGNVKLS